MSHSFLDVINNFYTTELIHHKVQGAVIRGSGTTAALVGPNIMDRTVLIGHTIGSNSMTDTSRVSPVEWVKQPCQYLGVINPYLGGGGFYEGQSLRG